jgi:ABC-type branched-subunit amino acid transport system permease subunit
MRDAQDDEIDKLALTLMKELERELGIAGGDPIDKELILPVVCALGSVAGHVIGMCADRVRGDLFRLHTQVVLDTIDEMGEEPETV